MTENDTYRSLSFWHETAPGSLDPRPPLGSDKQVDVAIVGAGYTVLWTAYYLSELQPGIRIALVEAEIAGFGAPEVTVVVVIERLIPAPQVHQVVAKFREDRRQQPGFECFKPQALFAALARFLR